MSSPVDNLLSRLSVTDDRTVWLRVGTLLDGVSTQPIKPAHVVYDKYAIQYVGDAEHTPPFGLLNHGQSRPDLNLPEYTLLPGLIDAHAHIYLEGAELNVEKRKAYRQQSAQVILDAARNRLTALIRLGVIGVRDAGDKFGVGLALSRLYENDTKPLMAYIDSPGAAIHRKGRYGSFMAEPVEDYATLKDCVVSRIDKGADRIKLIASDIIDFQQGAVARPPQLAAADITACVQTARKHGRQTFAHASGDIGIDYAIKGGVDSVEHGFFIRDDQLARLRDNHIAWVPTFAPVQKQIDHAELLGWDQGVVTNLRRILDQHTSSLNKAHDVGVCIIAGSDAGSYGVAHGFGLYDELELMERAGLLSIAVINAATGNSSQRLGYKDKFGRIAPGYKSRFILTKHSPLTSMGHLLKEKYVVFDDSVVLSDDMTR